MEQASALDPSALLLAHAALSLLAAVSTAPSWNLPLALFGLVVIRSDADGGDSVRAFAGLFAASFLLDLLWLSSGWRVDSASLGLLLILLNWVLKPVTLLSALGHLRARGEPTFALPSSFAGGFSLPGSFPPSNNARETVWSAPARGGYQGFQDEEEQVPAPAKTVQQQQQQQQQQQARAPVPAAGAEGGGYHTLE